MLELGEESEKEHKTIVELLKELNFKNVFLVGSEFAKVSEYSGFSTFDNVEELIKHLTSHPVSGHDILVKGSNGIHLNKLIDSL